jgi:hypothetical protein
MKLRTFADAINGTKAEVPANDPIRIVRRFIRLFVLVSSIFLATAKRAVVVCCLIGGNINDSVTPRRRRWRRIVIIVTDPHKQICLVGIECTP